MIDCLKPTEGLPRNLQLPPQIKSYNSNLNVEFEAGFKGQLAQPNRATSGTTHQAAGAR